MRRVWQDLPIFGYSVRKYSLTFIYETSISSSGAVIYLKILFLHALDYVARLQCSRWSLIVCLLTDKCSFRRI